MREAPRGGWYPHPDGVTEAGDVGGDIQAGKSWSVRFVRDDLPCCLIDVTFYPVQYEETPGEWAVQRQVEWLLCSDPRDPWGNEVWSRDEYDDVSPVVIGSAEEAEREARDWADAA